MKTKTSIFIDQDIWREFRAECIRKGLKPSEEMENMLKGWLKSKK